MPHPADLGHLETFQWDQLQSLTDRFEKAWEQGTTVDLNEFLPGTHDTLRGVALHELIKSDLEIRWRRGRADLLESYAQRFPELGGIDGLPASLLYEEFRARQMYGDHPPLSAYQSRFPAQYAELLRLVEKNPLPDPRMSTLAPPTMKAPATQIHPEAAGGTATLPLGDGYRLLKRIGSGTFGEVWQAEAPGGVPCAIKMIFRPVDHEEAQRELQALQLIKQLRHNYLLQTQGYWPFRDRLYIVMELADASLRDRALECRKEGLPGIPTTELMGYFREAAEALDYLHSQGVMHRDVKPANILLVKPRKPGGNPRTSSVIHIQPHVKVADFGLAKLWESQRLSASGVGTPAYMAPEVWRNQMSEHTDQYSLAAAWVELRLGRPLFAGTDMVSLMLDHVNQAPDLADLEEPERLALLKALAKDPEQRYGSCLEFVRALEEALAPPPPPPPAPSRWRWLVPAALVLVLCGLLTYLLVHQPSPDIGLTVHGPVEVRAGSKKNFTVHAPRTRYAGPIQLTFTPNVPEGLELAAEVTIPEDRDTAEVEIRALANAVAGPRTVLVQAVGGGLRAETSFELTVQPFLLPPNWSRPPDVPVKIVTDFEGQPYFDRVDVAAPDGTPVRFVLVPRKAKDEPRTFYIMEDKVWVGLFRKFAAQAKPPPRDLGRIVGLTHLAAQMPGALALASAGTPLVAPAQFFGALAGKEADAFTLGWEEFNRKLDDDCPVMLVHVDDAQRFARWLEGELGNLPEWRQWDRAAGMDTWRKNGRQPPNAGPFEASWDVNQIALNRSAPLSRKEAVKDVSEYGCRHMAGNGFEWTGNILGDFGRHPLVPHPKPPPLIGVVTRGMRYRANQPLHFADLEAEIPESNPYDTPSDEIGFRVVIVPR